MQFIAITAGAAAPAIKWHVALCVKRDVGAVKCAGPEDHIG
jgi:hypothetical protein